MDNRNTKLFYRYFFLSVSLLIFSYFMKLHIHCLEILMNQIVGQIGAWLVTSVKILHISEKSSTEETMCLPSNGTHKVMKKSLRNWLLHYTSLLPYYLAQSDCLAVDRQGQGYARLALTPSGIPNSNYVIMVIDWNCLKYFCVFFVLWSSGAQWHFDYPVPGTYEP
jgi:hypothetical protein